MNMIYEHVIRLCALMRTLCTALPELENCHGSCFSELPYVVVLNLFKLLLISSLLCRTQHMM
jgi:hypothetical protein